MLRIGKLTDYAMMILAALAKAPEDVQSATSLADALHLSSATVSKILKILSEAALVSSVRGAEGGYKLQKSAHEISVAQVIAVMEGDIAMTECCEQTERCTLQTSCSMKSNWLKINGVVHGLLSRLTVVDMMSPLSLQDPNHGK
jgi:FeS assembly SUF system regulator